MEFDFKAEVVVSKPTAHFCILQMSHLYNSFQPGFWVPHFGLKLSGYRIKIWSIAVTLSLLIYLPDSNPFGHIQ